MQDSLEKCERDVEAARAKFEVDLAVLRSPDTLSAFKDDLKREATDTRDEWVARTKSSFQSKMTNTVEDLKAKAAANPVAALSIGAGVGWYLLRHPSSALIGYGLYSLLKTQATPRPYFRTQDYIHQGQERLKAQARAVVETVAETASSAVMDASDKLVERSRDLTETARDAAVGFVEDILPDNVELPSARLSQDSRDRALLAAAGTAVAAAFLIALQKRLTANA